MIVTRHAVEREKATSEKEGKEVIFMEWTTPDFEEIETSCEVTAYAAHW